MTVSIITASYNYENYIKETIESVINQTVQDWEMIIVDDGSSDNSVEIVKSYCNADKRIKLFQHEKGMNKGLAETLKLGIEKASGEWIVFLESDDTITPDYLEEKYKVIAQYPDVSFIFNDINMFGNNEVILEKQAYFKKQKKRLSKYKFPTMLIDFFKKKSSNIIPTFSCVMCKKNLFEQIDFDSPIKPLLDLFLWIQISKKSVFYYVNKKLTNWRMHESSYVKRSKVSDFDFLMFNLKRLNFLYDKIPIGKLIMLTIKYKF